jgi:hypothetical protein
MAPVKIETRAIFVLSSILQRMYKNATTEPTRGGEQEQNPSQNQDTQTPSRNRYSELKQEGARPKQKRCRSRESNTGLVHGKHEFYH